MAGKPLDPDEPCPDCGDGEYVPAGKYFRCPTCDAEWDGEDEVSNPTSQQDTQ